MALAVGALWQGACAQEQFSILDGAIIATAAEAWETEDGEKMYLRRNVELLAPDWQIEADHGNLMGKLEDPALIVVDGDPARIFVSRDGDEVPFEGESHHIEFDPNDDAVKLMGEALIKKGQESVRSPSIDYDLDEDTFTAGDGGRVRVVTTPKD